jgi:hypothetical protein
VVGEFAHELEPALALEVLEVVAAGEFRAGGDAVGLEEVAPGFRGVEDAQDAEGGEGQVVVRRGRRNYSLDGGSDFGHLSPVARRYGQTGLLEFCINN